MDIGAWWTTVYGIAKSWEGLSVHMQITRVFSFLIPQTLFSLCNFLAVSYSFLVFTSIQFKMLIFF